MHAIAAVSTLLLGIGVLLAGNGLLGTVLGVRGQIEGFSTSVLGLVSSAYFAGFVLGTFIVPSLIRQVGHIRVFAALASLASVVTLGHGLIIDALVWMPLRLLSGVCIVGLYVVIESWLNSQTANEQRGHVFSAYMTTTLIGLGVGQVLLLAGRIDSLELFALSSILLSLGLIPIALTRVVEPAIVETHRLGLIVLYRVSPVGVVGCAFACLGAGAFWGLAPVLAAAIGLTPPAIAAFMALTILGGVIMLWPVGRLSDRIDRRAVLIWTCLLTALAAALALLVVRAGAIWLLPGGFAYGAFAFSIYALSAAHTNDHVASEQMLEVSSSLQLLWGSGAIIGPVLAGLAMQRIAPLSLLAFLSAAALVPALFAAYRMCVSDAVPAQDKSDWVPQFATSPVALEMHPDLDEPDRPEPATTGDRA